MNNKQEEKRILIRKIVIIAFLVMLVIGFTVPTLLDLGGENKQVQPRVCQADADCYLMCNDVPMKVLCSQNLCLQNSCEENSFYPFNSTPLVFSLAVTVNENKLDLGERSNPKDIFVNFDKEKVSEFSSGLSLKQILEKAKISLSAQCLTINQSYCSDNEKKLKFLVNGNSSYVFEGYVPQDEDKVEISYS